MQKLLIIFFVCFCSIFFQDFVINALALLVCLAVPLAFLYCVYMCVERILEYKLDTQINHKLHIQKLKKDVKRTYGNRYKIRRTPSNN